ncbi:hypothetical protein RUND412_005974 [Rhizina undulata]
MKNSVRTNSGLVGTSRVLLDLIRPTPDPQRYQRYQARLISRKSGSLQRDVALRGFDQDSVFDDAEPYLHSSNESPREEDTLLEEKDEDAIIEQSPIADDGVKEMHEAFEAPTAADTKETPVDDDLGLEAMNTAFDAVWGRL